MSKKPHIRDASSIYGRDGLTSWAARDTNGDLIEAYCRLPHQQQDPASTTKMWTLYTLATMMEISSLERDIAKNPAYASFISQHPDLAADIQQNPALANDPTVLSIKQQYPRFLDDMRLAQNPVFGRHLPLPEHFLDNHQGDINRMMVDSDNEAAVRLALAATGQTYSSRDVERIKDDGWGVPAFANIMNALGHERGLNESHWVTPNGKPAERHYSTAADLSLIPYLLDRDYGGNKNDPGSGHGYVRFAMQSNTGAGRLLEEQICIFAKTGTAVGSHGGQGSKSLIGGTKDGFFSVTAADDPSAVDRITRSTAAQLAYNNEYPVIAANERRAQMAASSDPGIAATPVNFDPAQSRAAFESELTRTSFHPADEAVNHASDASQRHDGHLRHHRRHHVTPVGNQEIANLSPNAPAKPRGPNPNTGPALTS